MLVRNQLKLISLLIGASVSVSAMANKLVSGDVWIINTTDQPMTCHRPHEFGTKWIAVADLQKFSEYKVKRSTINKGVYCGTSDACRNASEEGDSIQKNCIQLELSHCVNAPSSPALQGAKYLCLFDGSMSSERQDLLEEYLAHKGVDIPEEKE